LKSSLAITATDIFGGVETSSYLVAAVTLLTVARLQAQVVTDGTLGPRTTFRGSQVSIPAQVGQQRGGNLFHSFDQFNIARGNRVAFTGGGDITRVFARVTGGQASTIAGQLANEIPNADLYLINPAGITVNRGASFDVTGTLALVTANNVTFADGNNFTAAPAANEVLTAADPTAFGFLPGNNSTLAVRGANLELGDASLAAPNLVLDAAYVNATGQYFTLAGALGETLPFATPGVPAILLPNGFLNGNLFVQNHSTVQQSSVALGLLGLNGGRVSIANRSAAAVTSFATDVNNSALVIGGRRVDVAGHSLVISVGVGSQRGPAVIIGGQVIDVDASSIGSQSTVGGANGPVTIQARTIEMRHGSVISSIASRDVFGEADSQGGDVLIRTRNLSMRESGITTGTNVGSTGNSGLLQVIATKINLADKAVLLTASSGSGTAGALMVSAKGYVHLQNAAQLSSQADKTAGGTSGAMTVTSPKIIVDDSRITSSTLGGANAGEINLITTPAGAVVLRGQYAVDTIEKVTGGVSTLSLPGRDTPEGGRSGAININTGQLIIAEGASVSASTATTGDAGGINIRADDITLRGMGSNLVSDFFTSINSQTELESDGGGRAGDIDITGGTLRVSDAGVITSASEGTGEAGSVRINMDRLVDLRHQSGVTVAGTEVAAGSIDIRSGGNAFLLDGSSISAQSGGNGGNVTFSAAGVMAIGDSEITARAGGSGDSARIILDGARAAVLGNSTVNGIAENGLDVQVTVNAQNVLLAGDTQILSDRTLIPFSQQDVTIVDILPAISLDRGAKLEASCADAVVGRASTFLVSGREGVPGNYHMGTK
jgi:filamentous hemagglutinin family protein